jgi:hypothetical protein
MKKSALSRRPRRDETDKADVLAVIEKGGSSASGERVAMKARAMNLRIPGHLAELMDEARRQRMVRVSKNTWILEAIAEKIAREVDAGE